MRSRANATSSVTVISAVATASDPMPGHMPSQHRNASAEIAWVADTGSAQDLVCSK